ncbi:collagen alpha-2(VIII) chain-like [Camelus ferus]|uniref:Collagen alpha-2(VIII) chain-like n=1 Tax=Camelus ferus TaxID=419612 RepID=A0A8B8SGQ4_CAMFR|nr:collagen alpha-2(VIII) chain-like [Camelus ferus]
MKGREKEKGEETERKQTRQGAGGAGRAIGGRHSLGRPPGQPDSFLGGALPPPSEWASSEVAAPRPAPTPPGHRNQSRPAPAGGSRLWGQPSCGRLPLPGLPAYPRTARRPRRPVSPGPTAVGQDARPCSLEAPPSRRKLCFVSAARAPGAEGSLLTDVRSGAGCFPARIIPRPARFLPGPEGSPAAPGGLRAQVLLHLPGRALLHSAPKAGLGVKVGASE